MTDGDAAGRAEFAARITGELAAACPGSRAGLRGSLAAGTADAYSDVDVLWTVPAGRFGASVDALGEVLRRVGPVDLIRADPEFASVRGRRLVFAAFADVPLFWRLDLDVVADSPGGATEPTVTWPWPPAASALANAVAAVKALRRGRPEDARGLLVRAFPRVTAAPPALTADWPTDLAALVTAAEAADPAQTPLATRVRTLVDTHLPQP